MWKKLLGDVFDALFLKKFSLHTKNFWGLEAQIFAFSADPLRRIGRFLDAENCSLKIYKHADETFSFLLGVKNISCDQAFISDVKKECSETSLKREWVVFKALPWDGQNHPYPTFARRQRPFETTSFIDTFLNPGTQNHFCLSSLFEIKEFPPVEDFVKNVLAENESQCECSVKTVDFFEKEKLLTPDTKANLFVSPNNKLTAVSVGFMSKSLKAFLGTPVGWVELNRKSLSSQGMFKALDQEQLKPLINATHLSIRGSRTREQHYTWADSKLKSRIVLSQLQSWER